MRVIVVNKSGGLDIPVGGVILWYGNSVNVPSGYEIYTELKGFFPLGGASVDLVARGAATHIHTYPATAVEWKVDHTHPQTPNISGSAGGVGLGVWSGYDKAAAQYHSHGATGTVSGAAGAHRHTIGDVGAGSNLNSYHKLYYIRRVS